MDEPSVVYNETGEEQHIISYRSAITLKFIKDVDFEKLSKWKLYDCTGVLKKWNFTDDQGQHEIGSSLLLEFSNIRAYEK